MESKKSNSYETFKKYEVEASNLEEFLQQYTKPRDHEERGQEYVKARIKSHQEDINKFGFTFITHHASKTGEVVSWYPDNN